mmetsp:Transcript_11929/g.30076  ORF Transcript_11929/g.30076 Transcript_11929/m.30076 type:complete len:138 (+) Transcript_11929:490-903(+)
MEWLLSSISGPGELAGIRAIEFHPTKDNFQGAIVVATTARRARRLIRRAQHRIRHHLLRQSASATSIRKYSTETAAIASSNAQSAAPPARHAEPKHTLGPVFFLVFLVSSSNRPHRPPSLHSHRRSATFSEDSHHTA